MNGPDRFAEVAWLSFGSHSSTRRDRADRELARGLVGRGLEIVEADSGAGARRLDLDRLAAVVLSDALPELEQLLTLWRDQARTFIRILLAAGRPEGLLLRALQIGPSTTTCSVSPPSKRSPLELHFRSRVAAAPPAAFNSVVSPLTWMPEPLARPDLPTTKLTGHEVALLRYLARRPGLAVSHEDLLRDVWGYPIGNPDPRGGQPPSRASGRS